MKYQQLQGDLESQKLSSFQFEDFSSKKTNIEEQLQILQDADGKFKKIGNCYQKKFRLLKQAEIFIGPDWPFYLVGCSMFIGFDLFILYEFNREIESPLYLFNLFVLVLQISLYTCCFLKNPGYIKNVKISFEEESAITCEKCFAVERQDAFHCSRCDVCIEEYDHHCVWIGKCVGKRNYVVFYCFVVCTMLYFVVIILVCGLFKFTNRK